MVRDFDLLHIERELHKRDLKNIKKKLVTTIISTTKTTTQVQIADKLK